MHLVLCSLGLLGLAVALPAESADALAIKNNSTSGLSTEPIVILEAPERAELGMSFVSSSNVSDFEGEIDAGRRLAEEKKPKRKYCNTSAYGLKGDYAYEACGAFCKQAKAANHCKFCKCRACSYCAAMTPKTGSIAKSSSPAVGGPGKKAKKGAAKGRGKGTKGGGLKKRKLARRKLQEGAANN